MKTIPEPPILTLDPNDENIILKMPEEENGDLESDTQQRTVKEKMKVGQIKLININKLKKKV